MPWNLPRWCVNQAVADRTHSRASALLIAKRFATNSASFRCSNCGQTYSKWQGQCIGCANWGTIATVQARPNGLYRQANRANASKIRIKNDAKGNVAWANASGGGGGRKSNGVEAHFHGFDDDQDVELLVQRMNEVQTDTFAKRIELPDREMNWVLGGGLVAGSLTLIAGSPGVGKSTLALQMANMLASNNHSVLYVSGEESALQVKMRAERIGAVSHNLFVANENNLDKILWRIDAGIPGSRCDKPLAQDPTVRDYSFDLENEACSDSFAAVVIDSIQTVFVEDNASPAGSVNQVKECTLRLLRLAKLHDLPVLIVGHVTKSGDIAGPKVLEHIVDTVVQLEGDPQSERRFLRCQKNRFGNTSEVGVFQMMDHGLVPLQNPLLAFVSTENQVARAHFDLDTDVEGDEGDTMGKDDSQNSIQQEHAGVDGASITIAMEGSRPIPIEIQALATQIPGFGNNDQQASNHDGGFRRFGGGGFSRVRVLGVSYDRLQLLFAVLEKRTGLSFANQNVFVNVAEGFMIQEPAADLALAIVVASAVTNRKVKPRSVFIGEVALSSWLRPVKNLESRLMAAHKIGIKHCVIPRLTSSSTRKALMAKFGDEMEILEAETLLDALRLGLE